MSTARYQQLPDRVVWREGTLLQSQHMQQLERHFEGEIQLRFQAQQAFPWGLLALDLEESALQRGMVELRYLAAIMPDASALVLQEGESRPPARNLSEHFGADSTSLDLYISIPYSVSGAANFDQAAGTDLEQSKRRYRVRIQELYDTTGQDQRSEIQTAQSRAKLLFSNEDREGYCCLPIARIVRSVQGYALCPDFIAPTLDIRSSPALMSALCGLLAAAHSLYRKLLADRSYRSETKLEFSGSEMERYLWLSILGPAVTRLDSLARTPCTPAHRLHEELSALSCALRVLLASDNDAPCSPYRHDALHQSFTPLFLSLREMLARDFDTRTPSEALALDRDGIWRATIQDPTLFQKARVFLAIEGAPPDPEWAPRVLRLLKLSAPSSISRLIQRAMSGCPLCTRAEPLAELSSPGHCLYLEISTDDPHWQEILQEGAVAVYGAGQLDREALGVRLIALPH